MLASEFWFEASYGFENIRDALKLDPWTASYGVPEAFHLQQPSSSSHIHCKISHLFLVHHHHSKELISVYCNCTNLNRNMRNWHSGSKLIWRHLGDNIFLCHSCSLESMRNFNYSCKLSWRHLRDNILSCHSSSNFGSMSLHHRHEVPPPGSDITLNTGMENKIVWNAISDVYCALQACSPPGEDILGKLILLAYHITERWIIG
ncbi:hypothetical protein LWI28_024344 [Acer negundo]|uniref:Uncharacterized protein n=1 Tax=Acer negundo TaxID=4023 RepID=A0AAD5IGZ9_ACENE|nr:hypothetical protein LWI28_024344 [Acer negundo]